MLLRFKTVVTFLEMSVQINYCENLQRILGNFKKRQLKQEN
jgi:hypothetical protein